MVSTGWLADRLASPDVVVLFAGTRAEYDAGHITGARHLPSSMFTATRDAGGGLTLSTEVPPLAQLDSVLEMVGVSDRSRIVVYGGNAPAPVARLYVTLDHVGLGARTSVLGGGLAAWRTESRPLTSDVPVVARGSVTLRPRTDVIADLATVQSATSGTGPRILDARAPEFYSGASAGSMPRAGHIPTASNIPYTMVVSSGSTFKDVASLQDVFRTSGLKTGDSVITYCHIGLQASVLYVAARAAGYDARMYDGSFDEWSKRSDLPVAK
jgi:thiosulfate/3-mercaptopyruvate sulfurtransferase